MTAETINGWSVVNGDYDRPADADYDKEIKERRRRQKRATLFSIAVFIAAALVSMFLILQLTSRI